MWALVIVATCYVTGRVVTDHINTLESPGCLLGPLEKMGPMCKQPFLCKCIGGLVWFSHNNLLELNAVPFPSGDGGPYTLQRFTKPTLT